MKNKDLNLTDEQLNLKTRLEYGDISKIAKALGLSREHVSLVLSGKVDKPYIWNATKKFLLDRDKVREASIAALNS